LKFKEINFLLNLNTRQFFNAAQKAQAKHTKTKGKIERQPIHLKEKGSADILKRIAALGTAYFAITKALKTASDYEEAANKFNVVFSGMEARAHKFRDELVAGFAMSRTEATTFLSSIQDLLVPMGVAKDRATDLSFEVVKLAADLGSFNNLSTAQVIADIQSALVGNFETMKKYGVVLNETVLKQEAMNQGVWNGKGMIDAATKSQLAYDLIVRSSTAAMGDMARSADSYANTQKRTKARIEDATKELAEGFLPIAADVVDMGGDLAEAFAGMDDDTRKMVLTMALLTAVFLKAPAVISAVRTSIIALNASLGPAGWLALGIGAAASAWAIYSDETDDATESNKQAKESMDDLVESTRKHAAFLLQDKSLEHLTARQEFYNKKLDETRAKLADVDKAHPAYERHTRMLKRYKGQLLALGDAIKAKTEQETELVTGMTTKELAELDKRRKYQYENGRISLGDYINYLEGRREALKTALGAESVAYMQYEDTLRNLRGQRDIETPDQIDLKPMNLDGQKDEVVQYYDTIKEVETLFYEDSYTRLLTDYDLKKTLIEGNLEIALDAYGKDSDQYKKAIREKENLERNFQAAKLSLAMQGAQATTALGDQVMGAFQGQSRAMFNIGRGLAKADAMLNAYGAASRAYKDYPWPFNLGVAALQMALGMAQVANISKVKYNPKGYKYGGEIDQVLQLGMLPPGEDGFIPVQLKEMVMNKGATAEFKPILNLMNEKHNPGGSGSSGAGFANGGEVTSGDLSQSNATDLKEIVEAIRDIKIQVHSSLDTMQFFRKHYPEYEKAEAERSF